MRKPSRQEQVMAKIVESVSTELTRIINENADRWLEALADRDAQIALLEQRLCELEASNVVEFPPSSPLQ